MCKGLYKVGYLLLLCLSAVYAFGQSLAPRWEWRDGSYQIEYVAVSDSTESTFPDNLFRSTKALLQQLQDSGYWEAHLDSLYRTSAGNYRLRVLRGRRYYLQSDGKERPWTSEMLEYFAKERLLQDHKLTPLTLESRLGARLSLLGDSVYRVAWSLYQGKDFPLAEILGHGALPWRSQQWEAHLGLRRGALLGSNALERIDRLLQDTRYLRRTMPSVLELLDTGSVRLHLFAEGVQQNLLEGALGFRPVGGKMTFWGNAKLHLLNLLWWGEEISLSWVGRGRASQYFFLSSHFPYLFSTTWGVLGSWEAKLLGAQRYQWSFSGGISYRLGGWHELRSLVENRHLHSQDSSATVRYWDNAYLGHYLSPSGGGFEWEVHLGIGVRRWAMQTTQLEGRYRFFFSVQQPFGNHGYLGGEVRSEGYGRPRRNAHATLSGLDDFLFGGARHFRGLAEQQWTTPQYAYLTVRGGYLLSARARCGGVVQVGELTHQETTRGVMSLGGELLLQTNVGGLDVGISRFIPLGGWKVRSGWILHLQIQVLF